jgi:hypothetical protein
VLTLRFVNSTEIVSEKNREIGTEMTSEKPDEITKVFIARSCIEFHVEFFVKVFKGSDIARPDRIVGAAVQSINSLVPILKNPTQL